MKKKTKTKNKLPLFPPSLYFVLKTISTSIIHLHWAAQEPVVLAAFQLVRLSLLRIGAVR